jgi:hypothetical protein
MTDTALTSQAGYMFTLGHRTVDGSPQAAATPEQREAFRQCEETIAALYRIGETDPTHPERFRFFTEDHVFEQYYPVMPDQSFVISGKQNVIDWYEAQTAMRTSVHHARLHICTNYIWRALSDTELRSQSVMYYYEFAPDESPPAPRAVCDCMHRFRFEGGVWMISERRYWMVSVDLGGGSFKPK